MQKCPDCGNAPVNHQAEWVSSAFAHLSNSFGRPVNRLGRALESSFGDVLYNSFTPALMGALVALRLAHFVDEPDAKTSGRARVVWEEANRRRIRMREFRLFNTKNDSFLATYKGKHKTFFGLPRAGVVSSPSLAWMDNKEIMRQKFSAAGIPTPKGGTTTSVDGALALRKSLRSPLITKPETGSRSRHTTTHITTEGELVAAFKKAAQLSPWVIIQEELVGFVYRGTLIGGKLVAVLRREPPFVTADGIKTVAELIAEENKNPRRDEKIFHQIALAPESSAELARQGLALDSIPEKGREVTLAQKASRGLGGGTTDMTDVIHPDNRAMLEHAAQVLDDPLVGIDFIIGDVSKSWKEQERSGIIECNSMPFIDLHDAPLRGASRDVAGPLWDIVFPAAVEKV